MARNALYFTRPQMAVALVALLFFIVLPAARSVLAEVTLTVVSPAGTKVIALEESPEIEIGYTDSGMRLEFKNLNLTTQCIGGDISTDSGLCLLKAYQPDTAPTSPSAPGTPGQPSAEAAGPGAVLITWSAPSNEGTTPISGYRIQANVEGTSSWPTQVADTGGAATRYTVEGLLGGESYRFRVAATNDAGTGSNSPLSNYVEVEPSEDGITLASACINPPSNVKCDKTVIPANFYQPWGSQITQPANKVLSLPFIVAESTVGRGDFALKTFMSSVDAAADYSFNLWISATPNGPKLDEQAFCRTTAKTAYQMAWVQKASVPYGACGLGSQNRILYVNSKVFKVDSNGNETLYPYETSVSRRVQYTFSNSVSENP